MKIAAIIVSRKNSVRIQNKSRKKIKNQNLVERKIYQLKKVESLDEIYLGTNDLGLKKLTKKYKINFVKRENKYCDEKKTTANDMVKNMLKFVDADIILWAHPTNPFINYEVYEKAIGLFKKFSKNFDSLFSATIIKNHFWNHKKKPINHKPFSKKHVVASKLPAIFVATYDPTGSVAFGKIIPISFNFSSTDIIFLSFFFYFYRTLFFSQLK